MVELKCFESYCYHIDCLHQLLEQGAELFLTTFRPMVLNNIRPWSENVGLTRLLIIRVSKCSFMFDGWKMQKIENPCVRGSIPPRATKNHSSPLVGLFLLEVLNGA